MTITPELTSIKVYAAKHHIESLNDEGIKFLVLNEDNIDVSHYKMNHHATKAAAKINGTVITIEKALAQFDIIEPVETQLDLVDHIESLPEQQPEAQGQQVGYVRVSTAGQNTARQLAGVRLDKVFEEKVSAKTINRPELDAALKYVREGDTLHVHSLDRVCRSGAGDAVKLVEGLIAVGVTVHFHKEGMVFNGEITAAQRGVLGILASVAQMERELIAERRLEGVAAAKAAGKHMGRPKSDVTRDDVMQLKDAGVSVAQIVKQLSVSRATVYRLIG